jgi:hypothetical protein
MPTNIYIPSVIFKEIAPVSLFQDLLMQHKLLTPASLNSGIPTSRQAAVSSPKLARSMIRIYHAHYGTVPDKSFEDIAAGGITYHNGQKLVSAAGREVRLDKLSRILSDVQSERLGKGLYFQAFVRGAASTEDYKVRINDYSR